MNSIAYLVSEYPARSHTFIRREIAALRRLGLPICTFSVRSSASAADGDEAVETILSRPWLTRVGLGIQAFLRRPVLGCSTWRIAQRHRVPGFHAWLWSQFHFLEALILSEMMRRNAVSHLHCHFANSGATVGLLAARLAGVPFSLTLHGVSETDYPAGLLLSSKIEAAQFVACASWFIRAQAMRAARPDQWQKLIVVRCGVERQPRPNKKIATEDGPLRIITVGRLSPEKGLIGQIQALSQLRDIDWRLTIVGDGPIRAEVQREITNHDLGDRITLRGALTERDTLSEVEEADLMLLSSFMEGLPVVLMEAMALEKPVIAPRIAGIPELIEDGSNGLMFRPGDWEDLAEKIKWIAENRAAAEDMGLRGKHCIDAEFTIEHAVAPLAKLLSSSGR